MVAMIWVGLGSVIKRKKHRNLSSSFILACPGGNWNITELGQKDSCV